jgi:hypothetical protein
MKTPEVPQHYHAELVFSGEAVEDSWKANREYPCHSLRSQFVCQNHGIIFVLEISN